MKPYFEKDGCTIYHGDCLEVMAGLADASVDMIFTDPPYGHNNNNGDLIHRWEEALGVATETPAESRAIANDGAEANDLVRKCFAEWNRLLAPGCCCCCCCGGGGGPEPQFARWSMWIDEDIGFKQMVVWDKGPMGMGWHYRRSYETVLVAQKPGAACRWFDETNAVENIIRPGTGANKIIPQAWEHPTAKPVGLAAHFIRLHAKPGDLVLDPFCGGGSTAEAAMLQQCRFIGVELDERFCEMTAKRLAQDVFDWGQK